jgi:hypothetical protein
MVCAEALAWDETGSGPLSVGQWELEHDFPCNIIQGSVMLTQ